MHVSRETFDRIKSRKQTLIRLPESPYRVGGLYTLVTRKPHRETLKLTIMGAKLVALSDTSSTLRALGHRFEAEFRKEWEARWPWDPAAQVWQLELRVGDWRDQPRWLAARPGKVLFSGVDHNGKPIITAVAGDYTTEPRLRAQGELEAVPEGYQEILSTIGRARFDDERKKRGEGKDMRSRLRQQSRYKRAA